MDKIFVKILKTSFLGYFRTFWALLAWLNLFWKNRIHQFSYLMMHKIIKKKQQVLMILEILHLQTDGQTYSALRLGWVSNQFSHHTYVMDIQLLYNGTFLWDFGGDYS